MKPIASVSRVKEILDKYDLKAQKKFGQNFLIDANTVEKIAKAACDPDLRTIEIGPGIGSLTEMLAKYSKFVTAYEIDERLPLVLADNLKEYSNVEIILEDFLNLNLEEVFYKDEEINVCSNLPYYITTPILFKLFESNLKIKKITVMMQKEVADRFKASVNGEDYNALSVIVQYLYDVKLVMNVSKNVFNPKPNVDSAVLSFTPKIERDHQFEEKFFEFVKRSFVQRRKTLWNNLKDHIELEQLEKMYEVCGYDKNIRAQQIDLDGFLKMYGVIYER